jgi:hypothetical protein
MSDGATEPEALVVVQRLIHQLGGTSARIELPPSRGLRPGRIVAPERRYRNRVRAARRLRLPAVFACAMRCAVG